MANSLEKEQVDMLVCGRWLIPVNPSEITLENYAIAIKKGIIVGLMPIADAEQRYLAEEVYHLDRHVLLPGLINSHGHTAMSLLRGCADDQTLVNWLEKYIWPIEAEFVGEDFVRDGSTLAIAEMIRSGTTCFNDMYFYPNITAKLCQDIGIRAQISFPILDFPSAWAEGPDEYISKGLVLRDNFKHSELVNIAFGPHSPYTLSKEYMTKVATLAAELDSVVHIHLQETRHEIEQSLTEHQQRPLDIINGIGLLGPRTQCVHMTQVDEGDLVLLAETGAHVVHCPQSNMKLASGVCPITELLAADVNVALGTDSAASNNSLDMLQEMRTAALLAKLSSDDASALPAHQALLMATLNGAKAMGIENKVGSLEVGKSADFIAIDFDAASSQPLHDAISQVVYATNSRQVSHSWIAGKILLENGKLCTIDIETTLSKARDWQKKIQAAL